MARLGRARTGSRVACSDCPPSTNKFRCAFSSSTNLKNVSNDENDLFGGDFEAQYKKLWGLK